MKRKFEDASIHLNLLKRECLNKSIFLLEDSRYESQLSNHSQQLTSLSTPYSSQNEAIQLISVTKSKINAIVLPFPALPFLGSVPTRQTAHTALPPFPFTVPTETVEGLFLPIFPDAALHIVVAAENPSPIQ